jgi:hypothetical protein
MISPIVERQPLGFGECICFISGKRNKMWKNTDPREHINKRGQIVILRPGLHGYHTMRAGLGLVDTKEQYIILTDFEDHHLINADQSWDPSWLWAFGPEVQK